MFNSKFVDFLKTFNKVSNGVILSYPITSGKTDCSDIGFTFDISKFDDSKFDEKIGFIDLASFLNIFNLVDDPEITIKDGVITAKNKDSKVVYLTTAAPVLYELHEFPSSQFDVMNSIPSVVEIPLSASDIKRIKTASSSFKELDAISIKGDDNVTISLTSVGKFRTSSNSFQINKDVASKKNFDVYIKLDTFNKLPVLDYTVKVKYNETKDCFRLLFGTCIDGFELFVSTNV